MNEENLTFQHTTCKLQLPNAAIRNDNKQNIIWRVDFAILLPSIVTVRHTWTIVGD